MTGVVIIIYCFRTSLIICITMAISEMSGVHYTWADLGLFIYLFI